MFLWNKILEKFIGKVQNLDLKNNNNDVTVRQENKLYFCL